MQSAKDRTAGSKEEQIFVWLKKTFVFNLTVIFGLIPPSKFDSKPKRKAFSVFLFCPKVAPCQEVCQKWAAGSK